MKSNSIRLPKRRMKRITFTPKVIRRTSTLQLYADSLCTDIEHFMDHAHIEEVEEERVREFTGEPAEEEPADDPHMSRRAKEDAAAARLAFQADVQAARVAAAQNVFPSSDEVARQARAEYAKAQAVKFGKASAEAKARGAWGSEEGGFARPRDAADRLRANIPRKFKLKSSSWWGDF